VVSHYFVFCFKRKKQTIKTYTDQMASISIKHNDDNFQMGCYISQAKWWHYKRHYNW